jgi:hypothetical protein
MPIDHRQLLRPSEPPPVSGVPASDPFELWQLAPLSPRQFADLGTSESDLSLAQLRHLAAYNLLAPTSHNTVPQRFFFPGDSAIEICLDRAAVLCASDPSGRQALISIGCGLCNLLHAARRYGLLASVEVYDTPASMVLPHGPGEARYVRVARVDFRRGAPPGPEAVLHAMLERRSVRADYNATIALPAELAQALTHLVQSQYPELEFHLVSDALGVGFIAQQTGLADVTALNRKDFTTELGEWMVENNSKSPLGMRGREYGMSDQLTRGVLARLQSELRLRPEEVSGLAQGGNVGIRSSSAIGVIVVPRDDLLHHVLAGRALEDLLLCLHQHAFVAAMHAGITEIESANLAMQARLGTRGRPVVVFRMGQPLDPRDARRPHSARPSVSDVTLVESQLS